MSPVDFGVNQIEISLGDTWVNEESIRKILQGIVDLGGSRVRVSAPWDIIETSQNNPNFNNLDRAMNLCQEYGLRPLLFMNVGPNIFGLPNMPQWASPTTYGAYCKAIAEHYGPAGTNQVSEFEIWNEANNISFFPQAIHPEVYAEYLKQAYTAIKSVHPSSTVISVGTMAVGTDPYFGLALDPLEFIKGFYKAGAGNYCDAIGYHWYNNGPGFEVEPPSVTATYWVRLLQLRDFLVSQGHSDKKVWLTEIGVPYPSQDLLTCRDWLKTMVDQILAEDWLGPFFIYCYRNTGADTSVFINQFGVVDFYFNKKQPLWDYVASIRDSRTPDVTPPSAPTGVAREDVGSTSVALVWDASTDDRAVFSYRVYDQDDVKHLEVMRTNGVVTELVPGVTYGFYLTAVDAAGNESAPSDIIPVTTDAPGGQQAFYQYDFTGTGTTQPAVFIEDGEGFSVSSDIARNNHASSDGEYWSGGYYTLDQHSPDHFSEITFSSDTASVGNVAIGPRVRYSPHTGDFVAAITHWGGADSVQIVTCINGEIEVRRAENAPAITDGQKLRCTAEGNTYIAHLIIDNSLTELCRWVDVAAEFPGTANRRTGWISRHIRCGGANYDAQGINGLWRGYDLNPVLAAGGTGDPWMLAVLDESDWAYLFGGAPWEAFV